MSETVKVVGIYGRWARMPDAMEEELKKYFRPDKLRPMGTDEMTALTHGYAHGE
jgi:hypothetical protein